MTIPEANQKLLGVDCRDLDAVSAALTERARAIVEFAASVPKEVLEESFVAGQVFRDRLELACIETRRDLDRMTKLKRGLSATLAESQPDRVTCFG